MSRKVPADPVCTNLRLSAARLCTKSRSACEAGVSIKPGAQAPGSDHKKQARARETGERVKFTGFRPLSRAPTSYWYLNLGLAPQALCLRLLSQAKKHHSIRFLYKACLRSYLNPSFPFLTFL